MNRERPWEKGEVPVGVSGIPPLTSSSPPSTSARALTSSPSPLRATGPSNGPPVVASEDAYGVTAGSRTPVAAPPAASTQGGPTAGGGRAVEAPGRWLDDRWQARGDVRAQHVGPRGGDPEDNQPDQDNIGHAGYDGGDDRFDVDEHDLAGDACDIRPGGVSQGGSHDDSDCEDDDDDDRPRNSAASRKTDVTTRAYGSPRPDGSIIPRLEESSIPRPDGSITRREGASAGTHGSAPREDHGVVVAHESWDHPGPLASASYAGPPRADDDISGRGADLRARGSDVGAPGGLGVGRPDPSNSFAVGGTFGHRAHWIAGAGPGGAQPAGPSVAGSPGTLAGAGAGGHSLLRFLRPVTASRALHGQPLQGAKGQGLGSSSPGALTPPGAPGHPSGMGWDLGDRVASGAPERLNHGAMLAPQKEPSFLKSWRTGATDSIQHGTNPAPPTGRMVVRRPGGITHPAGAFAGSGGGGAFASIAGGECVLPGMAPDTATSGTGTGAVRGLGPLDAARAVAGASLNRAISASERPPPTGSPKGDPVEGGNHPGLGSHWAPLPAPQAGHQRTGPSGQSDGEREAMFVGGRDNIVAGGGNKQGPDGQGRAGGGTRRRSHGLASGQGASGGDNVAPGATPSPARGGSWPGTGDRETDGRPAPGRPVGGDVGGGDWRGADQASSHGQGGVWDRSGAPLEGYPDHEGVEPVEGYRKGVGADEGAEEAAGRRGVLPPGGGYAPPRAGGMPMLAPAAHESSSAASAAAAAVGTGGGIGSGGGGGAASGMGPRWPPEPNPSSGTRATSMKEEVPGPPLYPHPLGGPGQALPPPLAIPGVPAGMAAAAAAAAAAMALVPPPPYLHAAAHHPSGGVGPGPVFLPGMPPSGLTWGGPLVPGQVGLVPPRASVGREGEPGYRAAMVTGGLSSRGATSGVGVGDGDLLEAKEDKNREGQDKELLAVATLAHKGQVKVGGDSDGGGGGAGVAGGGVPGGGENEDGSATRFPKERLLPNGLPRCLRSNGQGWQCRNAAVFQPGAHMGGYSYCAHHTAKVEQYGQRGSRRFVGKRKSQRTRWNPIKRRGGKDGDGGEDDDEEGVHCDDGHYDGNATEEGEDAGGGRYSGGEGLCDEDNHGDEEDEEEEARGDGDGNKRIKLERRVAAEHKVSQTQHGGRVARWRQDLKEVEEASRCLLLIQGDRTGMFCWRAFRDGRPMKT